MSKCRTCGIPLTDTWAKDHLCCNGCGSLKGQLFPPGTAKPGEPRAVYMTYEPFRVLDSKE